MNVAKILKGTGRCGYYVKSLLSGNEGGLKFLKQKKREVSERMNPFEKEILVTHSFLSHTLIEK